MASGVIASEMLWLDDLPKATPFIAQQPIGTAPDDPVPIRDVEGETMLAQMV